MQLTIPPHAPLAQLDRASGYEPGGRRFESCRAHQLQQQLTRTTIAGSDRCAQICAHPSGSAGPNPACDPSTAAQARRRGDEATARFLEEVADVLENHLEAWTVTTEGVLVEGLTEHYIRIRPVQVRDYEPDENPNPLTTSLPS